MPLLGLLARVLPLILGGLFFSPDLRASDFRVGSAIGYGGVGLTSSVILDGTQTSVQRSEGPGIFSIFGDYQLSDIYTVGLEHIRGFRLGPFSTGASITGLNGHWYFMGPAPAVPRSAQNESVLLVKRYTPFVGLASGVAVANISRPGDLVPGSSASGVYVGLRLGFDYPIRPGFGLRPELTTSTTFLSQGTPPSTVSEFSLQCGLYMLL